MIGIKFGSMHLHPWLALTTFWIASLRGCRRARFLRASFSHGFLPLFFAAIAAAGVNDAQIGFGEDFVLNGGEQHFTTHTCG